MAMTDKTLILRGCIDSDCQWSNKAIHLVQHFKEAGQQRKLVYHLPW